MGKVTGFLELDRREPKYQPASDRSRYLRSLIFRTWEGML
jgi:glutamate synthase (NADPH) small chain